MERLGYQTRENLAPNDAFQILLSRYERNTTILHIMIETPVTFLIPESI